MDPIVFGLIVVLAMNLFIFPFAYRLQTDKLTDITYSLSFATIAVYGFVAALGTTSVAKMILASLIIIWALRLGTFLLNRVTKMGKDDRFDKIRTNPIRFLRFFLIQATAAWIISLPFLYKLLDQPGEPSGFADISILEWAGYAIAIIGLIIETIADNQKMAFKDQKGNAQKLYKEGLFKTVRYPNYTGEVLFWIGIFMACLPVISGLRWLTISSPLIIIALLVFLTGIPPIERSRKKKFGDNPEYKEYVNNTSMLIPGIY